MTFKEIDFPFLLQSSRMGGLAMRACMITKWWRPRVSASLAAMAPVASLVQQALREVVWGDVLVDTSTTTLALCREVEGRGASGGTSLLWRRWSG